MPIHINEFGFHDFFIYFMNSLSYTETTAFFIKTYAVLIQIIKYVLHNLTMEPPRYQFKLRVSAQNYHDT